MRAASSRSTTRSFRAGTRLFTVRADAVTVEDLGSRNGVSVNGERIAGRVMLRAGDRIQIGSQEMVLVAGGDGSRAHGDAQPAAR